MSTSLPCLSVIDLGWLALLCQTRNHLGVDILLQQERGAEEHLRLHQVSLQSDL